MIKKRFNLIYFFSMTCLLSPVLQAKIDITETKKHHQTILQGETPKGLTSGEWDDIQQKLKLAKYRPYSDSKGGYYSSNPAHGWKIHYDVDGTTTLTPSSTPAKPYKLGLKLTGIGYQSIQTLDRPQTISQKDFTVNYQWNENLKEWWINSDQQLEQWFMLKHRPEGKDKQQPLTLQMTLQSELKAKLNGNTLYFTDSSGTDISYNKLKVWDDRGQEIPAQMQLVGNTLSLLVDDTLAHYPLTIDPSFQQQTYLKASNTGVNDFFGQSVTLSRNTLVVGAWGEASNSDDESNNSSFDSGAVYVFIRNGSSWTQQAYLKASNPQSESFFGTSLSISGDTLVVGAYGEGSSSTGIDGDEKNNLAGYSGAAYVFTRTGSSWSQQAYLKASNTGANDEFGYSVALFGNTLVVGAHSEGSNSTGINGGQNNDLSPQSGSAYVFTRTGTTWTQQAYLKASNRSRNFGHSVSLYNDTLVVGANNENSGSTGVNGNQSNNLGPFSGAAYVFKRSGATWSQQAYLKASNTGFDDSFGQSVALYGDTLAVGASGEASNSTGVNGNQNDDSSFDSGAVYIFTRKGSAWSQQAYLKSSNTGDEDEFGISVALFGDTLVVGAVKEDSNSTGVNGGQSDNLTESSGAVYVFTRTGSSWSQQSYLKASNSESFDSFGFSVAISGDTLVTGAYGEESKSTGINGVQSDNSAFLSGAAYVFNIIPPHVLPSNEWHQVSLPLDPKSSNTVADIFGDDDLGVYGVDWIIFQHNVADNSYIRPKLTDRLSQGKGYWIIQYTGSDKKLEMPVGSATTQINSIPSSGCFTDSCFSIPLATKPGAVQMNLIGYPYGKSQLFSTSGINTVTAPCDIFECTLDEAKLDSIVDNKIWNFDGTRYNQINSTDTLDPWLGYWAATLNNADGRAPSLVIPKP